MSVEKDVFEEGSALPRLSEYTSSVQGDFVPLDELIDDELVIVDVEARDGQFGRYLAIQFARPGERGVFVTTCGGQVVVRKLLEAKEQGWFPCRATFRRRKGRGGRYWDVE